MLSTVGFFMGFRVSNSNDKVQSDIVIRLNHILLIWNLRYFMNLWIIKCVGLESILFAINLDVASSSNVFSFFDFVFLSIHCITNPNR